MLFQNYSSRLKHKYDSHLPQFSFRAGRVSDGNISSSNERRLVNPLVRALLRGKSTEKKKKSGDLFS